MRYTAAKSRPDYTFDAELEFKDSAIIGASAAAQVATVDKIIDVGTGLFVGDLIVDVTTIEIASNDERYDIIVQGSNSPTFASVFVDLASLPLGALEVVAGDQDSLVGRHILSFRNELNGVYYRYLRVYTVVAGAIAGGGGISYSCWAAPRQ